MEGDSGGGVCGVEVGDEMVSGLLDDSTFSGGDLCDVASAGGEGALVGEVDAAMVGLSLEGGGGLDWPARAAPGGQGVIGGGFDEQVVVGLWRALVVEDGKAQRCGREGQGRHSGLAPGRLSSMALTIFSLRGLYGFQRTSL